jgi:catechol 2,3-dioxygenase-like lactoylglutathione lyase family enzyme
MLELVEKVASAVSIIGKLPVSPEASMAIPKLRVARPTDDIEALLPFYRDGLGLEILFRFEGHDGFDGVMLGCPGAPYHFEFTKAHGHTAGLAPTQDNLLVFYFPDAAEWQAAIRQMEKAGFPPVPAFNSYWDQAGRTFEDPDGYRVVIQQASWNV